MFAGLLAVAAIVMVALNIVVDEARRKWKRRAESYYEQLLAAADLREEEGYRTKKLSDSAEAARIDLDFVTAERNALEQRGHELAKKILKLESQLKTVDAFFHNWKV